jgi:serine/threonine-protein kinase
VPERYVGRTVGRFRIDELVGTGGFAWVYRGYDPQLDIPVAVKILRPQYAGDDTFESRFRREASIAARLRHPNIIRIIEVGQDEAAVYFVMDYLQHGLVSRLRVMETLPESMLVRLGMDVANALAFAHRAGVIHRDIKADNILFDEHGNAIVADFGIARAVTSMVDQTGTNMVVGTPQYFSPEQARGLALDGRSDIYSLGVTLFRAATGRVPFEGADWYEIARLHVEEPPPEPRALNPAISPELSALILRCLAKSPDDRFASAEELHEALAALSPRTSNPDFLRTLEVPRFPMPLVAAGAARGRAGALTRRLTRRRVARVAGVATALAAVGVALALAAPRSEQPAAVRPAPLDTLRLPAESVFASNLRDSAGRVIIPIRSDSARIRRGALQVEAPREAQLRIDGRSVGRGRWRADSLREGSYLVSASVPSSLQGCPTQQVERRVMVNASAVARVELAPRGCGYLVIDAGRDDAQYTVVSMDDGTTTSGTIAGVTQVMLPAGSYRLRVQAPGCLAYESQAIAVSEVQATRKWLRLSCGG